MLNVVCILVSTVRLAILGDSRMGYVSLAKDNLLPTGFIL